MFGGGGNWKNMFTKLTVKELLTKATKHRKQNIKIKAKRIFKEKCEKRMLHEAVSIRRHGRKL